ncbi:hypothetical protein [Achromobacter aloeverae]
MLLAYVGDSDPFEPPTKVIVLEDVGTPDGQWGLENFQDVFIGICTFQSDDMDHPAFAFVSEEGKVWFHLPSRVEEDIADAGLFKPGSLGLGYLGGIKQLDGDLFAFGFGGQIYRRAAPGKWEHFDAGILGSADDEFDLTDMCVSGGTFYAVTALGARGRICARIQDTWVDQSNPTGEWLNAVAADPSGTVWACGRNGALVQGNAESGFASVGDPGCDENFLSIAFFNGQVWLCSANAIYTYASGALSKVETGLAPKLLNAHRLQAVGDVLWSFGYDDMARFDGEKWTRFVCPATKLFTPKA